MTILTPPLVNENNERLEVGLGRTTEAVDLMYPVIKMLPFPRGGPCVVVLAVVVVLDDKTKRSEVLR